MGYKEKPLVKLYKYENNSFVLQSIIDDYAEVTMTHSKYSSGDFSLQINYNIPNALLFEKNLFVQIGENAEDFFCINYVSDEIGEDGKQSQIRTISGKDCRYLFKRRIINSLNNSSNWTQTGKAEDVILALISDQCGSNAETKRKLPINVESSQHRGSDYTVTEAFTNLYEVIETITTKAELGWRVVFNNGALLLQFYEGTDRHTTVNFSTDFESLRNGTFEDSNENYANAVYVGGKGNNEDRDIYEGENVISGESPNGLDRFEVWDNQSSMTEEEEYENEANSVLAQYGQTINASGAGMIQCPYIFREEYFVGDIITLAFSGKSAQVQILSVTEHWSWNSYETEFDFGKPIVDLSRQLQLILNKIHSAELEAESRSKDSVKYYTIPTDTQMPKGDVTYRTIGFTGDIGNENKTFLLYFDESETGAKTYHVYFKNLTGNGKLVLSTGVSGKSNLEFNSGTYVAIIYVDEEGNVKVGASLSDTITSTTSSWSSEKTQTELNNKANVTEFAEKNDKISISSDSNDYEDTDYLILNSNRMLNPTNFIKRTVYNLWSYIRGKATNLFASKGDVEDIQELIPSQASSINKLSDKNFVNSSIATNTANFLGTYNTIEEIQALTNVTNNDYTFLNTTDSSGNRVFKRYKFNSTFNSWVYEYDLNNSSFTAVQWSAINSGITDNKVSEIDEKNDIITINEDGGDFTDVTNVILGGNNTTNPTNFVRRPASKLWDYIRGKINSAKVAVLYHAGSSSTWYLRLKLSANSFIFQVLITDFYGGTLLVTGTPSNDVELGASYHSVKVKRITQGDWVSDTSTSTGKLQSAYLDSNGYVYIKIGSYTNVMVSVLNLYHSVEISEVTSLPTNYREITIQ